MGTTFYILREAWNILNAIAEGKIESGDEKKLNALKGETMAVIALCQFDLTRCFGYPYTKDNGASLGAPLIDHWWEHTKILLVLLLLKRTILL